MSIRSLGWRFMLPALTLWQRELVHFYRHRSRIVGALGPPLVFWFLIGSGLGSSFQVAAAPLSGLPLESSSRQSIGYLEYFFPGTLTLILLFTAIFSTISIIEDRRAGFLQAVLIAPIARSSLVLGKLLGGTTLALLQGLLFLLLAPLIGISPSLPALLLLIAVLFLMAFGLTGLGFLIAWWFDSTQGFHAIMNLFLFPLWTLSGALFPPAGAAPWLQWGMELNPLTYGMAALRHSLYLGDQIPVGGFPSLGMSLVVLLLFAALMSGLATIIARRGADHT